MSSSSLDTFGILVAALVRWRRAHADWRQRRRAMARLRALSDRQLKDIGVNRSEIPWVVNHGRHDPLASSLGAGRLELFANPMFTRRSLSLCTVGMLVVALLTVSALSTGSTQVPDAIAAPGETLVATVHAQGAQVYECLADPSGRLVWRFREPIATLILDGKTVGRHYAGPSWELLDGGVVSGKVAGRAPGATSNDIPLLKLAVTSQRGSGRLTGVTTIQRLNTRGGVADGPCAPAGAFLSVPYSADYAFSKNADPTTSSSAAARQE